MRLSKFHGFLNHYSRINEVVLNNSSLVIDGHNFFYTMYTRSNLGSQFGCDCDSYAEFVRRELKIFEKANVKCFFIFRGGHEADSDTLINPPLSENTFENTGRAWEPLFAREVYKEVLKEMGFDYAISEYAPKRDCVTLAHKLNCPVLAFDIEYYFYGVKYIPIIYLNYNPTTNVLKGVFFKLDQLKDKYQLEDQQITIFIVLFNEHIFPQEFQSSLLTKLSLPLQNRYKYFLSWLSKSKALALKIVSKLVTEDEKRMIRLELERTEKKYNKIFQPDGLATKYFLNKDSCVIHRCDKEWFFKGVLWKFIGIPYIDVYSYGILRGSWSIEDLDTEDSMLLSAPIVRYAFDLLTNFNNHGLKFIGRANRIDNDKSILLNDDGTIKPTIRKPDYGPSNVFENGWKDVSTYQLFEHFLKESVQVEVTALQKAPTECRLLIAALVYFARRKCVDVDNEVYAVLLSFVVLGVVDEAVGRHDSLDDNHCRIARAVMDKYFTDDDITRNFDTKLLHPLVEFQHCLRHLNYLNTLCGSNLAPTVYSQTYNATFVYNILYEIKHRYNSDGRKFLDQELKDIPKVLLFVKKLFNTFIAIKHEKI